MKYTRADFNEMLEFAVESGDGTVIAILSSAYFCDLGWGRFAIPSAVARNLERLRNKYTSLGAARLKLAYRPFNIEGFPKLFCCDRTCRAHSIVWPPLAAKLNLSRMELAPCL